MAKKEKERLLLAQSDSADMAAPWVGGVASGLAYRYGVPVFPVRAAFAALSAFGGLGVLGYMYLWLTTPTEESVLKDAVATDSGSAYRVPLPAVGASRDNQVTVGRLLIVGTIFLGIAGLVSFGGLIAGISGAALFWSLVALLGLVLIWRQGGRVSGSSRRGAIAYVALGTFLLVAGTIAVLYSLGFIADLRSALAATVVIVLVTGLGLTPLGMRIVKDLTAARSREARETERADIAAHLHDSVLQTLTLIRSGAEDPARVRALALTQERELRSWLYTGNVEAEKSLAEALSNQASMVEATYGTAIEVVTVGDLEPGPAHLAAIAAATEAMTNAVRHGAPPVTVFQEVRGGEVEIFVKDAGAGFDLDSIPTDRHGFQNSIVGRVQRVGGSVNVRFLPAVEGEGDSRPIGGTEISIKLPKNPQPAASQPVVSPERERVFVAPPPVVPAYEVPPTRSDTPGK